MSELRDEDDDTLRNEWLVLQAEKLQNSIVNVNKEMTSSPSIYFGTRRCTYSDVISIVTTVKPFSYTQSNTVAGQIPSEPHKTLSSSQPSPTKLNSAHMREKYYDAGNFQDPLYVSPLQNSQYRERDQHEVR